MDTTFSIDTIYNFNLKTGDSVVWKNPNYFDCNISIILANKELRNDEFKIFPDPVNDELWIEITNNKRGEYCTLAHCYSSMFPYSLSISTVESVALFFPTNPDTLFFPPSFMTDSFFITVSGSSNSQYFKFAFNL